MPGSGNGGRRISTSSARTSRASIARYGRRCCWRRAWSRRMVFGHGFVYSKGEKISKTPGLGNFVDPMDLITKFSAEAFRYYFMRECPFPGDGDFSWQRFEEVYNADLANNLGNLYSRVVRLIAANYEGHLQGTGRVEPATIYNETDTETTGKQV